MIRSDTKEYKPQFLNFDKSEQRLDEFLCYYFGNAPSFTDLCKVFKILLILSHVQAQVERGCSINKQLFVDYLHPSSLAAQCIVNDHMVFHKLQPHEIDLTAKMVSHVRQARTRYLNDQKHRSLKKLQSQKDVKMQVLNDNIDDVNNKIKQLQGTIFSLKKLQISILLKQRRKPR